MKISATHLTRSATEHPTASYHVKLSILTFLFSRLPSIPQTLKTLPVIHVRGGTNDGYFFSSQLLCMIWFALGCGGRCSSDAAADVADDLTNVADRCVLVVPCQPHHGQMLGTGAVTCLLKQ